MPGAIANREEIRRNTQKHPIKNPTGPGEDMELPKYFFKLYETAPTGSGAEAALFLELTRMGDALLYTIGVNFKKKITREVRSVR